MKSYDADVIIVGAGPAGAVLSFLLAKNGLQIILVDRDKFPREKVCGDFITNNALRQLEQLGLVGEFEKNVKIKQMNVHLSDTVNLTFLQKEDDRWDFGIICERKNFDNYLCASSVSMGTKLIDEFTVTAPIYGESDRINGVFGRINDHSGKLSARLTVLASGGTGILPSKFGLHFPRPIMIANRAYYEGFIPEHIVSLYYSNLCLPGYSWIFPLGNGLLNVGMGVTVNNRNKMSIEKFINVEPKFSKLLNGAKRIGEVRGYPLRTQFLKSDVVGDGILTVGEASGLVNPLTGGESRLLLKVLRLHLR